MSGINDKNHLFYASVDIENGTLVEVGSRTVAVVGIADTIENAEKIAEKETSSTEAAKKVGQKTETPKAESPKENLKDKK